jgi:ribonucleoside-diphosphate reductase beta chain
MELLTNHTDVYTPQYLQFYDIWLRHERAHWNIAEADMRTDTEQWKNGKISEPEKAYIKMILRLFTQSDVDVCHAYVDRLLPFFQQADARMMLLSFAARETTHVLGYRHLNTTLGYDTDAFAHEFLQYAALKDKHEFMIEEADLTTKAGQAKYLAKQVLMEGISLFASFVMLLSFRLGGKIPGAVDINLWSIVDETIHVEGNTALLHEFLKQNPEVVTNDFKSYVYTIYTTLIDIEDASIDLPYAVGDNPHLTKEDVHLYIRYMGDYRLQQLGFKPQYNIKENPCPWVEEITGNMLGNFFERTSVEYSKGSLVGDWGWENWEPTI